MKNQIILTILLFLTFSTTSFAQGRKDELGKIVLEKTDIGSYYQYAPKSMKKPFKFLVLIHGMVDQNFNAVYIAKSYIKIFQSYSDKNGVVLIVPAFDKYNYGSYEGPLGGYRGLIGRVVDADEFLNRIIDSYKKVLSGYDGRFAIIGHSAGGQFVGRYIAKHPERVIAASIIAPGTYMFFNDKAEYPWGIGRCYGYLEWNGSSEKRIVDITPDKEKLKEMFQIPIKVIVGSKDIYKYDHLEGQIGLTRIERGRNWVEDAKKYAKSIGVKDDISFVLLNGEGHGTSKLFTEAVKDIFNNSRK